MKFTLLLIASIAVSVHTADTTNCVNVGNGFCYACGATDCTACSGSFLSGGKCTAVTAVTNCWEYSSATACSMCNPGFYLSATNTCVANPTTGGTGFIAGCAVYQLVGSDIKCIACSSGVPTTGALVSTVKTVTACSTTALTGNCGVSKPGDIEAAPARVLADGSTRVLAAGDITNPVCHACAGTFVLETTDSSCAAASDTLTAGCIKKTGAACVACNPTSHQMREAGKCSAKPTTGYSAILSVVSMIVALMFANF